MRDGELVCFVIFFDERKKKERKKNKSTKHQTKDGRVLVRDCRLAAPPSCFDENTADEFRSLFSTLFDLRMQQGSLALRRGTVILTVLMAVSKFKALGFRARARRAKTKYRKQIESDDRRWGGRRLKLCGRAVTPIPAGRPSPHLRCSMSNVLTPRLL